MEQKPKVEYNTARRGYQQNGQTCSIPHTPSHANPSYKKLQFNRYADDFVAGIIGSCKDAERVKADIRDFLATPKAHPV